MIHVQGTLIPNRLIQDTDVMKLEPDKETDAYWKKYWEEMAQSADDFIKSPQMPVFEHYQMLKADQLEKAKQNYARLGFEIPEMLPAEYQAALSDRLYIVAILPKGWRKIKGDNSEGFCYVNDDKGARRVEVWIMNTTTERRAEYKICGRYEPFMKIQTIDTDNITFAAVRDNKTHKTIYTSHDSVNAPAHGPKNAITLNKLAYLRGDSYKWLNENFGEWKNPFAYWD